MDRRGINNIVRYQSPIILVPGIDSMEGNFPPDSGGLVVVGMIQVHTFIDFVSGMQSSGSNVNDAEWL